MIISTDELKTAFPDKDDVALKRKADAIEQMIRSHTNNNFQNRTVRYDGFVRDGMIISGANYLKVGDTIQLSESVNRGLFVITGLDGGISVDGDLFDEDHCLVTKVEYPADVVEGAFNLIRWDVGNRSKVGIKSESLSRHSTTYYDMDSSNSLAGYPASLIGFLKPYMKARF